MKGVGNVKGAVISSNTRWEELKCVEPPIKVLFVVER